MDLPPSAAKFKAAAADLAVAVEIVVTAQPARTAEEAALACGCDVGQIVKSLVFRGVETRRPLVFLVSGRNRVDLNRAAEAVDEPIARPDAAFVRAVTGYAIGGIPPFGHDRAATTLLDAALLDYDRVWAAAGTPNTVFAIAPGLLRDVTRATVLVVA